MVRARAGEGLDSGGGRGQSFEERRSSTERASKVLHS